MSILTDFLKLFKYDNTDKTNNVNFNIEKSMNENWDKIEQNAVEVRESLEQKADILYKPDGWKTENDLPNTYPNKTPVMFRSNTTFGGLASSVQVYTLVATSGNVGIQAIFRSNGEHIKFRLAVGGLATWGDWQTIATSADLEEKANKTDTVKFENITLINSEITTLSDYFEGVIYSFQSFINKNFNTHITDFPIGFKAGQLTWERLTTYVTGVLTLKDVFNQKIYHRTLQDGNWSDWKSQSDIETADFLKRSGDSMLGRLTLPHSMLSLYLPSTNTTTHGSGIGYDIYGAESLAFMAKHLATTFKFKTGHDPMNFTTGAFTNMTNADLEIGNGYCKINNNLVWHAGNDGTGSGLDADLLDGKHASGDLSTVEKTNLVTAINECFQFASNGKSSIATTLNNKGATCSIDDTFTVLAAKIATQMCKFSGTAIASNVLSGKTFINSTGNLITGNMPNQGNVNATLTTQNQQYTIPAGYHAGGGKVTANISNLIASNIKNGVNVGGVVGNYTQVYNASITLNSLTSVSFPFLPDIILVECYNSGDGRLNRYAFWGSSLNLGVIKILGQGSETNINDNCTISKKLGNNFTIYGGLNAAHADVVAIKY